VSVLDDVEELRPDEVVVELLKDGTVYDTVRLNAKNPALDHGARYAVFVRALRVVGIDDKEGIAVARNADGGTEIVWTIQENAVPGYISSIRETGDTFILTNTPEHQKLPQTGLLWWPVPVLAAAGLLLLILGTLLKRKNDHD